MANESGRDDAEQLTEADTRRLFITPKLVSAGWDRRPHGLSERRYFTDGRIVLSGREAWRRKGKRADYVLRSSRDFPLAVVEAKRYNAAAAEALQQAKEYAQILDLKFAYATNGSQIIEFDFLTGEESLLDNFPTPEELLERLFADTPFLDEKLAQTLLQPLDFSRGKPPRYYQEIAINRAVASILSGQKRLLLTMATGTGKTQTAVQIVWKLWQSGWRAYQGRFGKPRVLYLADRNILVDDPREIEFASFGDARWKIEGGEANKSRDIYFATYQSIAADETRPGLYKEYPPDFFDLIIVDECHRGSSRANSVWREILNWFEPGFQLGLTATPLREESQDTYAYFQQPVYEYSLRQGINDGFLAPYRVHRVLTSFDAVGWRPTRGQVDRFGRTIPEGEYHTPDFDKVISLKARTEAVARHLSDHLKQTDRFAKTIVFCVDQEHAAQMRDAIADANADLVRSDPDYVCRVTAAEGNVGRAHLSAFQAVDTTTPTILTTSQLLTTGVNAPTVKNIVLVRPINSMIEFKQIIGRGTRVREDCGKLFFDIIDYTGSATRLFADPAFDGKPVRVTEEQITDDGEAIAASFATLESDSEQIDDSSSLAPPDSLQDQTDREPRKYYVDDGHSSILAHYVSELDAEGRQLRTYAWDSVVAEEISKLCNSADELSAKWADRNSRLTIIELLRDRGIQVSKLPELFGRSDVDPLDVLRNVAFKEPLLTRLERAEAVKKHETDFFAQYGDVARKVLFSLLDKYSQFGIDQLSIPDVLKTPPISDFGNVIEIAGRFGGTEALRDAVDFLQTLIFKTPRQHTPRPTPVFIRRFDSNISLRREDMYDDEDQ